MRGQVFETVLQYQSWKRPLIKLAMPETCACMNLQRPAWYLARRCWVSEGKGFGCYVWFRVSNGALPWCWYKYHSGCCTSTFNFAAEALYG